MKKLYIVYVHITPDGMHYYGVTNNPKYRQRKKLEKKLNEVGTTLF